MNIFFINDIRIYVDFNVAEFAFMMNIRRHLLGTVERGDLGLFYFSWIFLLISKIFHCEKFLVNIFSILINDF
jgi:hypothetical protein